MQIDPNWVSALANVAVAGSIYFLARQTSSARDAVEEARKQRESDHERSRRQTAIDLVRAWNESVSGAEPSARHVVESFDARNCQKLLKMEPFLVPQENIKHLRNALAGIEGVSIPTVEEGKDIVLSETCLYHLGRLCHKYLSTLEVTLIAWRNNMADKEIIEQQLSFVVKPQIDYYCLRKFRDAMGGVDAYPNIQAFVDHVSLRKKGVPLEKDAL